MKLLERDENNLYSNTYTSETFLNRNDMSNYFGSMITFHAKMDRWAKFAESVTTPDLKALCLEDAFY
jgi:hypothetical protein